MRKKTWLQYIVIMSIILLTTFWVDYTFDEYKKRFSINIYFCIIILDYAFYIAIGLLLGIEHFILEIKRRGKWKIDVAKLLIMGLPSLYFSLGEYGYFGFGRFLPSVLFHPIAMVLNNAARIFPIFHMILGYTIITSFYKKSYEI